MRFFEPNDFWGVVGIVLFLVAMGLVLSNGSVATNLFSTAATSTIRGLAVLQMRSPKQIGV